MPPAGRRRRRQLYDRQGQLLSYVLSLLDILQETQHVAPQQQQRRHEHEGQGNML